MEIVFKSAQRERSANSIIKTNYLAFCCSEDFKFAFSLYLQLNLTVYVVIIDRLRVFIFLFLFQLLVDAGLWM